MVEKQEAAEEESKEEPMEVNNGICSLWTDKYGTNFTNGSEMKTLEKT